MHTTRGGTSCQKQARKRVSLSPSLSVSPPPSIYLSLTRYLCLSNPVYREAHGEACLTQRRAPSRAHFICRMNVRLHIFSIFIPKNK